MQRLVRCSTQFLFTNHSIEYTMKLKKYISLAGLLFPLGMTAQTDTERILCDFESNEGYTNVSVYDTWENSPFRKKELNGNIKVCNNPLTEVDPILGFAPNTSAKVLGAQRSQYGSNTFGALISLAEPIQLSLDTKYIHVKVYTTEPGRFMLIGMGKRTDRPGQSNMTEQLWETSISKIGEDKWFDAVFPISGNPGAELHHLLIVPDLNSPHNRTEDFLFYMDDIQLSNSAAPRFSSTYYNINFDEEAQQNRTDRNLTSISLQADGKTQTIQVGQAQSKKLYTKKLEKAFTAKAGETVTPTFSFNGAWMSGYVFLDKDIDGRFNVTVEGDEIKDKTDLVAYSFFKGKDSAGNSHANGNRINPPAFTIPSDLKPGVYRLRYKVDWDNVNPGGSDAPNNTIISNGGAIVDTRLIIHGDEVTIKRGSRGTSGGLNGDVLKADGTALTEEKIPFGKPYTVTVRPENGFVFSHFLIRHGNITSEDSLHYDTPQFMDVLIPGFHVKDNTYEIPAEYVDGDVEITPYFRSTSGDASGEDYKLNFDKSLTVNRPNNDRMLNSFTMATGEDHSTKVTLDNSGENLVYRDMMDIEVDVKPGDRVTTTTDYKGRAMHGYFYVDFNNDGQFTGELGDDGRPTINSELLAYSHYQGKNSLGETVGTPGAIPVGIPDFTIPANLPTGNYRARYKIDWSNIDPAGQWSEGGKNQINENGGYVVDFLLNVHNEKSNLDIRTTNGSVVGANNSGLPQAVSYGQTLDIMPVAAAEGYEAQQMVIRHGHGLDGEEFIKGNRQWKEEVVEVSNFTLPASMVNGEVRITVNFEDNGSAKYKLRFSDEFDQKDGKMDLTKWNYRDRTNPTWARFIASTDKGRELTNVVKDGKYQAMCLANPFDEEKDDKGNKLQMLSGAIHSDGKFAFQYGKVEGRMVTTPHTGNFPAFWMMPAKPVGGWPACGEIDIWEQINTENKSHHTIHSKWGNTLNHPNDPVKTHAHNTKADEYHTFGFEWTDELLTWFIDGKQVFSYAKKKNDQNALNNGQWPFDQQFYLILNQSVGDGSWASAPDAAFTYKTMFDWVRVYQTDDQVSTGISSQEVQNRLDVYATQGQIRIVSPSKQLVSIVDLQGRLMYQHEIQGNETVEMPKGVYIVNGKKVVVS